MGIAARGAFTVASQWLHSGFTVEGIRTPGMPSTTVLLLAGTAVMAVPFLLRS